MTATMTRTKSIFTVRPSATIEIPTGGDAGPILDRVLSALEADDRALGVGGVACDYTARRIDTTFQIEIERGEMPKLDANHVGRVIFDGALSRADVASATTRIAIVEGDDPDLLP